MFFNNNFLLLYPINIVLKIYNYSSLVPWMSGDLS